MPISSRLRTGAALAATLLVTALCARLPSAHAEPAYQDGFIAYRSDGYSTLTTVAADGSDKHSFSMQVQRLESFAYSPDHRHIAFVSDTPGAPRTDTARLSIADADGTNAVPISTAYSERLSWTPDGSAVLVDEYAGIHDGIYAISAFSKGSPPTKLFTDPGCLDRAPQATTRGYIFFHRECYAQSADAVFRLGDSSISYVGAHSGWVSADGSREVALTSTEPDGPLAVAVAGVDSNAPSRTVASISPGATVTEAGFTPSGGIYYVELSRSSGPSVYSLKVVSDRPGALPRTVTSDTFIGQVDWTNGPSNLPTRPVADRIGGTDRVDTAVKASQWAFDTFGAGGRQATAAVLTRSDLFPDALAGTTLAIRRGGPLLLTSGGGLDQAVAAELSRILAPGSRVYLLGGTAALSPAVASAVRQLGFTPTRLGGTDRYETALSIAKEISGNTPRTVMLATGTDFPDALTAGVAAGQDRYPASRSGVPAGGVVLLTDGATLPAAVRDYLMSAAQNGAALYAVGGPAARAMDSQLPPSARGTRLVGSDRFQTAALVAGSPLFGRGVPGRYTVAGVATGLNFPDALSGGALVGAQGGPLLLSTAAGLPAVASAALSSVHLDDVVVMGGPAAVSDHVLTSAAKAAFGDLGWDVRTNRAAPPLR